MGASARSRHVSESAITRVRRFASPDQTGELVKIDPALIDQAPPEDYERSGIATLDDVEGYHPDLPIKTSLKEQAGNVVTILAITFSPTSEQFKSEKRSRGLEPEEMTAVIHFRGTDSRYYVAVAGNSRVMREAITTANLLRRVAGVRARIEAYQSLGGTGYHLGAVGQS